MIQISNITRFFHKGDVNEVRALNGVSLSVKEGEFITIIGSNGAGKSTFLNGVAGCFPVDSGAIVLDGIDVTSWPEFKRAALIGRVFQDPLMGTCAGATIEQNMALALKRGKRRGLSAGVKNRDRVFFQEQLSKLGLGLENRLKDSAGLLDEHTAALDPSTAAKILELTESIVAEQGLTTLMVTHNMNQAITLGNRLVMFHRGEIILDIAGEEKQGLRVQDLLERFQAVRGEEFLSDRALLS